MFDGKVYLEGLTFFIFVQKIYDHPFMKRGGGGKRSRADNLYNVISLQLITN